MSPLRSTRFLSSPILRLHLHRCGCRCCAVGIDPPSPAREEEGRGGEEASGEISVDRKTKMSRYCYYYCCRPWRPPSEVPLAPVVGAEVVSAALSPKPSGMRWDGRRAGWLVGDRPDLASHPRCIKRLDDYRILSPVIHVDLTPPFMFMTNFIENGNIVGRLCTLNLRSY